MNPRSTTPPPTPAERAKRKKRIILIVGVSLAAVMTIVFFVVPLIMIVTPSSRSKRIVQKVEDMNNVRQMVGVMVYDGAPAAPDGRIDVYKALLASTDTRERVVEICHGAYDDEGPTIEQVRSGDYSRFPFVRAKGAVTRDLFDQPLLWDPAPREHGERVVGFASGAVKALTEAEFQQLVKTWNLE